MRTPYIAGNWKLNLDRAGALDLARGIAAATSDATGVDLAVAPPYVHIEAVAEALRGTSVRVGAQNCCDQDSGAFTGEISARMLKEVGATFAIVGHSERRHVYGESDELIAAKLGAALAGGLDAILCLGELLEEREAGRTESVVRRQLTSALADFDRAHLGRLTLAYEPVWAIGTGKVATPDQAEEVHAFVRGLLAGLFDDAAAASVRIQYGGSVKPDNARELLGRPNVDGALVGGASLKADSFTGIAAAIR
ncbi:Triosephosphate isomerase [Planctomycetes bacterium Pla163]|uniref:Triosephosphate isomerase n=1 Tax=Rohdeia mirabilis TaxID=2528008 RepID=A0A518D445_9BACT|nr:Triosephosphate isomerase [Planctomycetes bacterium Pla163]